MADSKLEQIFGKNFPGFGSKDGKAWRDWINQRYEQQKSVMGDKRLYWSRNRQFRIGRQWLSTRDGRQWYEPRHDSNTVRQVLNLVGPALDFRLGVLMEQRPGWRSSPLNSSTQAREEADAQQMAVESYFKLLETWRVSADAGQAAQTDGTAFLHVFKDRSKGPVRKRMQTVPKGDARYATLKAEGWKEENGTLKVPVTRDGEPSKDTKLTTFRGGDIGHRVVYAWETFADPESKTINGPYDKAKWFVIRRLRDLEAARLETDDEELEPETEGDSQDPLEEVSTILVPKWERGLPPYPTSRRRAREGVWEYLIFFNGGVVSEIPKGGWVKIIGNKYIDGEMELPGGVIPLAQFRDGSTDPDLYPRPVMNDWIGDQMAVNALASLMIMHGRVFGLGRMLAQSETTFEETWTSMVGSVVQYTGLKPEALSPQSVSSDLWNLITFFVKQFENKSAYTDVARGQLQGQGGFQDISGRSVLAAKEMFERQLGPMVRAHADGMTEWAKLVVVVARDLFGKDGRMLSKVGGRADLARKITAKDLGEDDPVTVVEPETLVPLPRQLRLQILENRLAQGLIDLQTFKEREPYGLMFGLMDGPARQWNRAQTVNQVLIENWEEFTAAMQQIDETGQPDLLFPYKIEQGIPVLWTDQEDVHMNALLEIILDDRKAWGLRALALSRYSVYEDVAKVKAAMQQPMAGPDGRPLPLPPLPVEVVGAPASLPRRGSNPPEQQLANARPTVGQTSAPTNLAAVTPQSGFQAALPLGEFGSEEANMNQGVRLPR